MADLLAEALAALRLPAGELRVQEPERRFGGSLDCDGLLRACAGSALLAAAELAAARGLGRPAVALDAGHLALACVSERLAGVVGEPALPAFAPLSAFAATADGHVRLHANYPHHRAALVEVVGAEDLAACATWTAEALEAAVVAAGGCAAAVRTPEGWAAHPHGAWLVEQPLVVWEEQRDARAAPLPSPPSAAALPASGLRVLDLTRVIAGPVATRTLAALGADVLRLGHPGRPELELHVVDGLVGKRAAVLDLDSGDGADRLEQLLEGADVLITGYRPHALERFGLGCDALAARFPHLVDVRLSAWGDGGPWGRRRGFDSLVQAACGIAALEGADGAPGALPCQALDHGTGFLAAAAALRGLIRRAEGAAGCSAQLALGATAAWLMRRDRVPVAATSLPEPAQLVSKLRAPDGRTVTAIPPPGTLDGRPLAWSTARTGEDADPPRW